MLKKQSQYTVKAFAFLICFSFLGLLILNSFCMGGQCNALLVETAVVENTNRKDSTFRYPHVVSNVMVQLRISEVSQEIAVKV